MAVLCATVMLSDRALEWLVDLDRQMLDAEAADVAHILALIATITPAWTEVYSAIISRNKSLSLLQAQAAPSERAQTLAAELGLDTSKPVEPNVWSQLGNPPTHPRVVDVEFPAVVLSRAEWIRGSLYLQLVRQSDDTSTWTEFRIVGVEPRMWDVTGIDGVGIDVRSSGVVVRVPLVSGGLEFTPGSY